MNEKRCREQRLRTAWKRPCQDAFAAKFVSRSLDEQRRARDVLWIADDDDDDGDDE